MKTIDDILIPLMSGLPIPQSDDLHFSATSLDLVNCKRQLFDAFMAIIGEDEQPDTMVRTGAPIKGQPRQYKPHYSLRAQFINETKAQQRQAARRFFNIPEAEQGEKTNG